MKRGQARLAEATVFDERLVDEYHAFFVCCFHLKDWLKADQTLGPDIGRAAEVWINQVRWLRLCADLANRHKHLTINRHVRIDPTIGLQVVHGAFPADAFQTDAFQTDDEVIVNTAGEFLEGLLLVNMCVINWELFLREKGLLPPASTRK